MKLSNNYKFHPYKLIQTNQHHVQIIVCKLIILVEFFIITKVQTT